MKKYAHLKIEIRFVAHGYQVDIFDNTLATPDGQGVRHITECSDFADSSPSVCDRAEQAKTAIQKALRSL